MGWSNPIVPWNELERALSGRPPRPGRGPIGPLRPLGHDRPEPDPDGPPIEYPSSQRRQRPTVETAAPADLATRVPYAELHCHSAFSFLDGASTPELLVAEALRLGLDALAITDHDGLYGIVRFAEAAADTPCARSTAPSCRSVSRSRRWVSPTRSGITCWCWPAVRRATTGCPRRSAARSWTAARRAGPIYDLDDLAQACAGSLADPHRLPQGAGPAGAGQARPGRCAGRDPSA